MSLSIFRLGRGSPPNDLEKASIFIVYCTWNRSKAWQSSRFPPKLMHRKSHFSTEDNPPRVRGGVVCKRRFREEQIRVLKESGHGAKLGNHAGGTGSEGCFYRQLEEQNQQLTPDATY